MRPGSKSSIELNFRSTAIWLPSPARVLSTLRFRPGPIRAITSLKLSRSICTNLRSVSGGRGLVGSPENSPMMPMTKGSSRSIWAPSVSTSYLIWTRGFRTRLSFSWILALIGASWVKPITLTIKEGAAHASVSHCAVAQRTSPVDRRAKTARRFIRGQSDSARRSGPLAPPTAPRAGFWRLSRAVGNVRTQALARMPKRRAWGIR